MTPSQRAKSIGCKSLTQVSIETHLSLDSLRRKFRNNPPEFDRLCMGVVSEEAVNKLQAINLILRGN